MGSNFFKKTLKHLKYFLYCFYSFCSDKAKYSFYNLQNTDKLSDELIIRKDLDKTQKKTMILTAEIVIQKAKLAMQEEKVAMQEEKVAMKEETLAKNNKKEKELILFLKSIKQKQKQTPKTCLVSNKQNNTLENTLQNLSHVTFNFSQDSMNQTNNSCLNSFVQTKTQNQKKNQKKINQTTDNWELEQIDEKSSSREPSEQDTKTHYNTNSSPGISVFMNQKAEAKRKTMNHPTKIFVRSNSIEPNKPNKINMENQYPVRALNMPMRIEERQTELENRPRQMTGIEIYSQNQKTNQKLQGRLLDNSKQKTTNEKKQTKILELFLVKSLPISPKKTQDERIEEQGSQKYTAPQERSQKISLRCTPQKERLQKSGQKIGFEKKPLAQTTKNSPQKYAYLQKKYNLGSTPKKSNELFGSITGTSRSRNISTARQAKTYTLSNNASVPTENPKSKQMKTYNKTKTSRLLKTNIAYLQNNNHLNIFSMPKRSVDSDSTRPIKSFQSFNSSHHISKK